jgi:hypothetical protein
MHFKYLSSVAINLLKIVSFYRQECKGVVWFLDLCSRHDIAEIFLMLALNTNQSINQPINQSIMVFRDVVNELCQLGFA